MWGDDFQDTGQGLAHCEARSFPPPVHRDEEADATLTVMYSAMRRAVVAIPATVAFLPYLVFAQGAGLPKQIVTCNGAVAGNGLPACGCEHLIALAQNLINTGIFIAIFLSAMLFAYAGWLYLTNEAIGEQQKAKGIFANVVIGLIIILAAWLVVDTLMKGVLKDNITWNNICAGLGL